jgi:hypothetical protein
MSITDCKHRHHHNPERKQEYGGYFYQLCQCLGCDSHFVQVTSFDSSTHTYHVLVEVENVDSAKAWILSQP